MVRAQASNGKSRGDEEAQRKLLGGGSGWSSDEDSEIEFDASRVLEKPLSIKAKPNARIKRPKAPCGRTEASLVTILAFAVVIIFLLMGVVGWMFFRHLSAVCMLTSCIQSASHVSKLMNVTAPPCDDFYNFACGSFAEHHPIEPNSASSSWFTVIRNRNERRFRQILSSHDTKFHNKTSTAIQKLKIFYRSCMDEKLIVKSGFNPMTRFLHKHGGWTLTPKIKDTKWDSKKYDLTRLLIDIHRGYEFPLFKMAVVIDPKKDAFIIKFRQHGLTFKDDKFYANKNAMVHRMALLEFATDFASLTGSKRESEVEAIKKKFDAIFDFEAEMAKLYPPREAVNDPWKMYNIITVNEFKKKFTMIDLDAYLKGMFDKKIPGSTNLYVPSTDYFTKLSALVKKTSTETITNYILWRRMESLLSYLPPNFRAVHIRLLSVKNGVRTPSARWKFCSSNAGKMFGFALSAIYVNDYVKKDTLKVGKTIIHYVRDSLKKRIEGLKWMDESTKEEALKKLDAMDLAIGYPDWILKREKLDEYYEKMSISDQLLENVFYEADFKFHRKMKKYGTQPDYSIWDIYPHEQNAYYSLVFNKMVVPVGLMEVPFLDRRAPMAVNFGSLGMFVGHEMTHGFDVRGRNYDKRGKLKHWWTAGVSKKFRNLSECVMKAYGKYKEFGVKLNSKYTVNENIADDGGLKIAYYAYQKWSNDHGGFKTLPGLGFSPDQLFYIGYAQSWCTSYRPTREKTMMISTVHPPHRIRVQGAISNSKNFATVFHCAKNSPMNPKNKCIVWGS